ncbi:PAS domain-containing sensor histidine kinase [Ramlibacter albus]
MPSSTLGNDLANARLAGLLDSAMDAIITVDESQKIVLYNRAAEKIFGWKADEMRGQPLDRLIPERYQAAHGGHVKRFGETGVTSRRMSGSSIVYGKRANGEEFPVDASISQLETPEGKLFTVILRDVTDRMQSEEEQMRLAQRLGGLLDSAMDGIISVDEQQRVILYNRAAEKIFGWNAAAVLGQPLERLMPRRYRGEHSDHVRTFGRTGVTSRRMGDRTNIVYGLRANGEEFPMEASISQLETAQGKVYTVIMRDVTERVRAERELATFAAESAGVREQEKSRIARELHDELAQSLTALKMDTIFLQGNIATNPAGAQAKLDDMLRMLDTAVASTRRIAADLRPLVLDDLGLVPAIEWAVQNFTQRSGIKCVLDLDEDLELEEPYATAAFRIVQESLQNAAKHSKATKVRVRVSTEPEAILLRIEDNGVGFAPDAPRKAHSLGIAGLRERAYLLRGKVAIHSAPGQGTTVEARIPVEKKEAA